MVVHSLNPLFNRPTDHLNRRQSVCRLEPVIAQSSPSLYPSMTLPVFLPTAARTRVVGCSLHHCLLDLLHLFHRQQVHDLIRVAPAAQQVGHQLHRVVDVVEEQLVSGAQVVQSWLAIGRVDEAVAWAFAITGEQHFTITAVLGQAVELVLAEFTLLVRANQLDQVSLFNIAQQERRFDEVVAGVQVAVVFQGQGVAAGGLEDAQAGLAHPVCQGCVEGLHEDLANIPAHPLIEDGDQEAPVLLWLHCALGDQLANLSIQRAVAAGTFAPALVSDGQRLQGCSLDDGDELHVLRSQLIAEEVIDLQRVVGIGGVHRAQDVHIDAVLLQKMPAAHHLLKAAGAALVDPVGIVQGLRAVHAQPNQEIVLFEEGCQFVINFRAVGLDRVQHGLTRYFVFFDQLD